MAKILPFHQMVIKFL